MPARRPVRRPIRGAKAFAASSDAAVMSQAAVLLLLGAQLRGDDRALKTYAAAVGAGKGIDANPLRGSVSFPVPSVRFSGDRIDVARTRDRLASRFGQGLLDAMGGTLDPAEAGVADFARASAEDLYQAPTAQAAAELLEVCLRHPAELTRVAAAASYFELTTEPLRVLEVLRAGTHSSDNLVRDVAATALGRIDPSSPRLAELARAGDGPAPPSPPSVGPAESDAAQAPEAESSTSSSASSGTASLLVHGTFATNAAWYQPGGDFHTYILEQVRPDLYNAPDFFFWSGGYSNAARAQGAADLLAWVSAKGFSSVDVFGHSHGANVAMLASQFGLAVNTLVLLSCPVHIHRYLPNFAIVNRVVSIHVTLDLVIIADLGGQRFKIPQIEEHVLPVWFDHQATHYPDVWQTFDVPSMI